VIEGGCNSYVTRQGHRTGAGARAAATTPAGEDKLAFGGSGESDRGAAGVAGRAVRVAVDPGRRARDCPVACAGCTHHEGEGRDEGGRDRGGGRQGHRAGAGARAAHAAPAREDGPGSRRGRQGHDRPAGVAR